MLAPMMIFLLALSSGTSFLEQSLRQSYEKQVRAVRHYYADSHLKYDESGTVIGNAHSGPWTLGYVVIEKVRLAGSNLKLHCKRVGVRFIAPPNQLAYIAGREDVEIDVEVAPALNEMTLRKALDKIFYPPNKIVPEELPDYWQDLMRDNIETTASVDSPAFSQFRSGCPAGVSMDAVRQIMPSGVRKIVCNGMTIYRVKWGGVKAIKAVRTPDPRYTEFARQAKFQGTTILWLVVDETGHPQMIRITRPLGFGLDDMAVEAVSKWLFTPAELEGHPVAVEINVEVNFRLY